MLAFSVLQVCLSRGKLLAEKAVKDHVSINLKLTLCGLQLELSWAGDGIALMSPLALHKPGIAAYVCHHIRELEDQKLKSASAP